MPTYNYRRRVTIVSSRTIALSLSAVLLAATTMLALAAHGTEVRMHPAESGVMADVVKGDAMTSDVRENKIAGALKPDEAMGRKT